MRLCCSLYSGSGVAFGLITLPDSATGTDSDSDSESDGYIVLCRTCSHCTDYNLDPSPRTYPYPSLAM